MGGDLGQRFLVMERDRRPTANTVLLRGNRRGGVPAQAVSALVKGQASADIEPGRQLPQQPASGFRVLHVKVVVGDEQPAKILFNIQLPN